MGRALMLGTVVAEFVLVTLDAASPNFNLAGWVGDWFVALDAGLITWITGRAVASRLGFQFKRKNETEEESGEETES